VAPLVEEAVVEGGGGLRGSAVVVTVGVDLAVVEELGDDGRDVVALDTCGDVLAESTTRDSTS
jgi:hypothetical protein